MLAPSAAPAPPPGARRPLRGAGLAEAAPPLLHIYK